MLDVRFEIVRPALQALGAWSAAAEELVIRTGIAESGYGPLTQQPEGPARSWWQVEPATCADCWASFLDFRPALAGAAGKLLLRGLADADHEGQLTASPRYAAAICRIVYLRAPGALPDARDLAGQAAYWKAHYNTAAGAGTAAGFVDRVERFRERIR